MAVLLAVALSTAIHAIVVSQARYNLPLMPSLIAAGVAGWFMAVRRQPLTDQSDGEDAALVHEQEAAAGACRHGLGLAVHHDRDRRCAGADAAVDRRSVHAEGEADEAALLVREGAAGAAALVGVGVEDAPGVDLAQRRAAYLARDRARLALGGLEDLDAPRKRLVMSDGVDLRQRGRLVARVGRLLRDGIA